MAELDEGTFNYTLADCESLTSVDGTTYSTDTALARSSYGVVVFLILKSISGDQRQVMTGDDGDRNTDNVFTADIQGGGVNEINAFIVPKFGETFFLTGQNYIYYYDVEDKFYYKSSSAVGALPAAPNSNYTVIDETDVDAFFDRFNTAFIVNDQGRINEGYYEITKYYETCELENKLSDIIVGVDKSCHTGCTLGNYEKLRRKFEAGSAYFTQDNYTQAQEMYEDAYDHMNSNSCC
jgi:hypothetical protein